MSENSLKPDPSSPSIGVALSGGGHRASAWALGALLYLVDVAASSRVRSIASVSGGSITNGFVALRGDYAHTNPADFTKTVAAPLAKRLATDGTVFADAASRRLRARIVFLAIAVAILSLAGIVVAVAAFALAMLGAEEVRGVAMLAGSSLIAAGILGTLLLLSVGQRGRVTRKGYNRILYEGAKLSDMARTTEHVLCTTDVQFAEHVYWSPRFVYSYRLGVGKPGDVLLADAVGASAGFPGGFPPLVLRSDAFQFEAGAEALPSQLVLLDGGVYDNMADQWFVGIGKRLSGRDPDPNAKARAAKLSDVVALKAPPSDLIVVNASPAFSKNDVPFAWWPAVEIAALVRTVLALHDNATSLRRKSLVDGFISAEKANGRSHGVLVHIGTNPEATVAYVMSNTGASQAQKKRAASARRLLGSALGANATVVNWDVLVKSNKDVPTVLDPLGLDCIAGLMQHACVLAAVQCHVFLDYPLPHEAEWTVTFGRERFEALAGGYETQA